MLSGQFSWMYTLIMHITYKINSKYRDYTYKNLVLFTNVAVCDDAWRFMEASEKDFTLKFSFISSAKQQWMEAQCVLVKPTIIIPKVC